MRARPEPSSVATCTSPGEAGAAACAYSPLRKPSSDSAGRALAAPRPRSRAARSRCLRRRAAPGCRGRRLREADAERADEPQSVARVEPASRSVPGPIASSRNSSRPSRARQTENARPRCGRARLAAPAARPRQHVELPGSGLGPSGSSTAEQAVRADRLVPVTAAEPPPEGRQRARSALRRGKPRLDSGALTSRWRRARPAVACRGSPCSSWSDVTVRPRLARGADRARRRRGARHRRDARDAALDRGPADLPAVGARPAPDRGVDHEVHVAAADAVGDVRRSLADLVQLLDRDAHLADRRARCRGSRARGSRGRACARRAAWRPACRCRRREMKTAPSERQRHARRRPAPCRTRSGSRRAMPITSPVDFISGPSSASAPWRRWNGSTASFTLTWPPLALARQVLVARAARRGSGGRRPSRAARRSPSRRTAPCATRAGSPRSRTGGRCRRAPNCTFSSPTTPSRSASSRVWRRTSSSISSPRLSGGSTQAESPECTPASSTCCMIPAT